jgi:hypothetical protein
VTRAAHTTAGTRNAPSRLALIARATTSAAVRAPVPGERFAKEVGMRCEDVFERRAELAGRIEMRRIGARFVVYGRQECGAWPGSEEIESVVAKVRRSA